MNAQRQHGAATYRKVFDQRKRRIRGLWESNGGYCAQLRIKDEATGKTTPKRTRLEDENGNPVTTAGEAVMAMNKLKVERDGAGLSLEPKRTPTFAEYADACLGHYDLVKDAKSPATVRTERTCISRLKGFMGDVRLRQINQALVNGYIEQRQPGDVGPRSINLELVVLRNVLKHAVGDGLLTALPIEGIKWLKDAPTKRRLLSHDELDHICAEATAADTIEGKARDRYINGREFADFVRLMACSGGRWAETLVGEKTTRCARTSRRRGS